MPVKDTYTTVICSLFSFSLHENPQMPSYDTSIIETSSLPIARSDWPIWLPRFEARRHVCWVRRDVEELDQWDCLRVTGQFIVRGWWWAESPEDFPQKTWLRFLSARENSVALEMSDGDFSFLAILEYRDSTGPLHWTPSLNRGSLYREQIRIVSKLCEKLEMTLRY
jgi:hypothetical protein